MLLAILAPNEKLKELQDKAKFTELMIAQEAVKVLPFGDIWNEYCEVFNVPTDDELYSVIEAYEVSVLSKR